MPQHKNVPSEGAKVYYPAKNDKRPEFEFRVGETVVHGHLAGPVTSRKPKPIVREVIDMTSRQVSKRPLMPDPYTGEE